MASTPASMLKIVSSGLEDLERLNAPKGQPSTQFYKTVIRQHTRWASQWRRVEFDNVADFGRKGIVTLPILGELITRAILVVVLPDIVGPQESALATAKHLYGTSANPAIAPLQSSVYPAWSWTNSIGHALCSDITFQINNQLIDTLDSRLLEVIDEQHSAFDHFDTTNFLIGRDPSTFNPLNYNSSQKIQSQIKTVVQTPQTVQVVPPFWWNRGPGPQPLPIQALSKDPVQIVCNFRPAQDCIYTDYRTGSATTPIPSAATTGFYYPVDASTGNMTLSQYGRDPATGTALPDVSGVLVPGAGLPAELHFVDAYWIVEYVSLEDREAAAFRLADLQIPVETHVALPVTPTNGAARTRMDIEQGGLVRDITWVAQRVEAPNYNAYFLFSQDLAEQGATASETPWWPNASFPSWDFGDGYINTGFSNTRSDPLLSATFRVYGKERFDFTGPSFFRSLMPIMNCKRAPLVNRYIYRYDFGMWSTGGIADANGRPVDEVRGCANWDKMPYKEIEFMMADNYYKATWTPTGSSVTYPNSNPYLKGFDSLYAFDSGINVNDQGYLITMYGAGGRTSGNGAYVSFTVDNRQIQGVPGFIDVYVRRIAEGSIALVVKTKTGYFYLAVAGAGGQGVGGTAGTVITCGNQGGAGGVASHVVNPSGGGGGGGGRSYAGSTDLPEGPGSPDGSAMTTDETFIKSLNSTGGTTNTFYGGDGYYGGGSGDPGGGGGGSYVSSLCTNVSFGVWGPSYNTVGVPPFAYQVFASSSMTIQPLTQDTHVRPSYNIHAWLTTYNMLRITGGRGALMFD